MKWRMIYGRRGGVRGGALNELMHTLPSRRQKESPSQLPTSRSMREPGLSFLGAARSFLVGHAVTH